MPGGSGPAPRRPRPAGGARQRPRDRPRGAVPRIGARAADAGLGGAGRRRRGAPGLRAAPARSGAELAAAPGAGLRAMHDELLRTGTLSRPNTTGPPDSTAPQEPTSPPDSTTAPPATAPPPPTTAPPPAATARPDPAPRHDPPAGLVPALPARTARGRIGFVGAPGSWPCWRPRSTRPRPAAHRWSCWTGEAGIGKTRLATQFAELERRRRRALALYGRCDEDAVVPYQPFVEALRRHLAAAPVRPWRDASPPTGPSSPASSPS